MKRIISEKEKNLRRAYGSRENKVNIIGDSVLSKVQELRKAVSVTEQNKLNPNQYVGGGGGGHCAP